MKIFKTSKRFRSSLLALLVIFGLTFGFSVQSVMAEGETVTEAAEVDPCWDESSQVLMESVTDPTDAIAQALEQGLSGSRIVLSLSDEETEPLVVGDPSGEPVTWEVGDSFECIVLSANGRALDYFDIESDANVVIEFASILRTEDGTMQFLKPGLRLVLNCTKVAGYEGVNDGVGKLSIYGGGFQPLSSDLSESVIQYVGNADGMPITFFDDPESDNPVEVIAIIESPYLLCGFIPEYQEGVRGQGAELWFDSLGSYADGIEPYRQAVEDCETEAQQPEPEPEPEPEPGCPEACPNPEPEPEPEPPVTVCTLFIPVAAKE